MLLRPRPDNKIAFGAELSSCTYRLTLARYASIAEFLKREVKAADQQLDLLDIACGEGRLILYGPFPGIAFHGIDVRPTSLTQARDRGYKAVVRGNIVHGLPFPDRSFDCGVIARSLLRQICGLCGNRLGRASEQFLVHVFQGLGQLTIFCVDRATSPIDWLSYVFVPTLLVPLLVQVGPLA